MKVFGIVGWKNSGKTTLMERLVTEIISRGISVSTIKHAHHSFDIDQPGKDSHRHRVAGAREVLLASRNRWALMHELRQREEPSLAFLLGRLGDVDLVLIEGYKRDRHAKIEVHRAGAAEGLLARSDAMILAVASNSTPKELAVPVLDIDKVETIADFILAEVDLP